jgi:hypothetical protein
VWQLASIQQQMHALEGSDAKYLTITEDKGNKLKFDFAPDDEKAVSK